MASRVRRQSKPYRYFGESRFDRFFERTLHIVIVLLVPVALVILGIGCWALTASEGWR